MQLRGIQFSLMPNRWTIIEANLFRRQICGYGEITLFESIIIFPPQPRSFWLILTSQLYRITASFFFFFLSLFYSVFFIISLIIEAATKYLFSLDSLIIF